MAVSIVHIQVQPGAECAQIVNSMRVQIAQAKVAPNEGCNKPVDPMQRVQVVIETHRLELIVCACKVCWGCMEVKKANFYTCTEGVLALSGATVMSYFLEFKSF